MSTIREITFLVSIGRGSDPLDQRLYRRTLKSSDLKEIFPFSNLTFDQMVDLHLPKAREIFADGTIEDWKKYPLYFMFIRGTKINLRILLNFCDFKKIMKKYFFEFFGFFRYLLLTIVYKFLGHYSDVFALDEMFGKKFILIDGELFKTKPWVALGQIEKSLGMKNYFTQDRFGQRKVDPYFLTLKYI